jgi:hypothetical protein
MPTTTNYGWTTPADTDLVKDGAAAIRTLGSSIDTSVKSLNAGTTAGDIDYYTSSTAKARVGIGTTGQVLTVAGGVPSWATSAAGGMTLLSTTTLSGASTTISSINQTYKSLFAVIYGVTNATANGIFQLLPNSTGSNCTLIGNQVTGFNTRALWSGQPITLGLSCPASDIDRTSSANAWTVQIDNYASASNFKPINFNGGMLCLASSQRGSISGAGTIDTNTAITSLQFSNTGGNLSTGTVLLYGVN